MIERQSNCIFYIFIYRNICRGCAIAHIDVALRVYHHGYGGRNSGANLYYALCMAVIIIWILLSCSTMSDSTSMKVYNLWSIHYHLLVVNSSSTFVSTLEHEIFGFMLYLLCKKTLVF